MDKKRMESLLDQVVQRMEEMVDQDVLAVAEKRKVRCRRQIGQSGH